MNHHVLLITLIIMSLFLILALLCRILLHKGHTDEEKDDVASGGYEEVINDDYGRIGESLIYEDLEVLERQGARFLLNAYVPKRDGSTSEVDLIMISQSGIFVIESKHYSGQVSGNRNEQYWKQTRRNKEINRFYNPIRQNESHCLYLSEYLGLNKSKFLSYIVFSDKCEFKNMPKSTKKYRILHRKELLRTIRRDMNDRGRIFSKKKAFEIYADLYPLTQESEEVKRQHREGMRKR